MHEMSQPRGARTPRKGCRALARVTSGIRWRLLYVSAAAVLAASPAIGAQGVSVALLPAASTVSPGATFELSIEVTRAGSSFNAFDMYVGYDPAALTLLPTSPISLQEGSYFTGACSNRYHRFQAGTDRDTITDVLLCAGVSLAGPGQIYKLRFRAANLAQVTTVRFLPGLQFYNSGLYVNPDSSTDATIGIGVSLAVPGAAFDAVPTLAAWPNPARGRVALRIASPMGGEQSLWVADLQGRRVRDLEVGQFVAGTRMVAWDGRDDSGRAVAPGVYVGFARIGARLLLSRFVLIR